jgi:hypothetical protein
MTSTTCLIVNVRSVTAKILKVKVDTSINLAHLPARTGPPALCLVCACSSREGDFLMFLKQSIYFSYMSMAQSDTVLITNITTGYIWTLQQYL